jgi:hypothetical protein
MQFPPENPPGESLSCTLPMNQEICITLANFDLTLSLLLRL